MSFGVSSADDLQLVAAAQRRELMAAKERDSDLDFAFNLQLQEAISASLLHQNLTSTSAGAETVSQLDTPLSKDDFSDFTDLQAYELLKLDQELKDIAVSETEFRKSKTDLHRRMHDQRMALEISEMSDEEWEDWGDEFELPFGEGSSKGANAEIFRVYFRGLVEKQVQEGNVLGGIGVAICDSKNELLFELRKPLVGMGMGRQCVELRALIEALNAALELELDRVSFYCDYYPVFQFVTGRWFAKQRKVWDLLDKVSHLRDRFTYCEPFLMARNDVKFAFKFARDAIKSQVCKPAESSRSNNITESCVICLEDKNTSQFFSIDDCMHRYCFQCMKQHVEVKLLYGILPMCPFEGCKSELKINRCRTFLTPKLVEIMSQRIIEASIPASEKVYCPYPTCSALMSKTDLCDNLKQTLIVDEISEARKCIKCNGRFCINCKVPWHADMTCLQYKKTNPHPQVEEARLKNLAATNMWRQCVKCNHMIELAAGCYHMTCRCGHEFCYTCGAEWRNRKATCSCPLWDEENILDSEFSDDEYDDEDEDEDEFGDIYHLDSESEDYPLDF